MSMPSAMAAAPVSPAAGKSSPVWIARMVAAGISPIPPRPDRTVSLQKWRSTQEIDWITAPPGVEKSRAPTSTRFGLWNRAIAYRGYKRGIETYVNPWAADDPGQPEVSSRIGDGFNLDGKVKANDFVSPDGEKGIDNALYRAWGCDAPWRGNGNANLDMRANDKMQDGLYTMVIRVSGNQDPLQRQRCGGGDRLFAGQDRQGCARRHRHRLFLSHPAIGPVHQDESERSKTAWWRPSRSRELHSPAHRLVL